MHLPDTPAAQLRMSLARSKATGCVPFDLAWRKAIRIVRFHWEPGQLEAWHALLADERVVEMYRAAYENTSNQTLVAFSVLASTLRSD